MALSGIRDGADTVADLVNDTLSKMHITEEGSTASAGESATMLRVLRGMLRTWAAKGIRLWLNEVDAISLIADTASYVLDPRALEVSYAYVRDVASQTDTPIRIYTRQEYERLPNKSISGRPYVVWIDRQAGQSVATVYPVPTDASFELRLTVKRQINDVTALAETLEVPPEWYETLIYNLAVRAAPDFSIAIDQDVKDMAKDLYNDMSGQDREGSVVMRPGRRR